MITTRWFEWFVEHEASRPLTTLEYMAFLMLQRLRTAYILSLEFIIRVVERIQTMMTRRIALIAVSLLLAVFMADMMLGGPMRALIVQALESLVSILD